MQKIQTKRMFHVFDQKMQAYKCLWLQATIVGMPVIRHVTFSYRRSREKLLKYQANSLCMILSLILVSTLSYKTLISQGEI